MNEASLSRIGRYEIRQTLGRGAMGVVYLAEDPALERLIALKTIDLAFAVPEGERDAFEQRFLTEARIAAKLSHPGIVVVHDVGRDGDTGILFIALEYLQGRTLEQVMAEGAPMDWREALRITAQVARALHQAHAHGIVHRDVKPANIMLLPSGEPKIMDFGIAKVPHLQLTSAGQFFGTPLYMSPEQALGQPVDGRADIFSLGAIGYLLLTGQQAFKADNVLQVLSRVVHDHPPAPSRLVSGLPQGIDELLARALAKSPADRYPDGETLARDVDNLLAGRPLGEAGWLQELVVAEEDETPLSTLVSQAVPPPPTEAIARPTPRRGAEARPAAPTGRAIPATARAKARLAIWIGAVLLGVALTAVSLRTLKHGPAVSSPSPAARSTPRAETPAPEPSPEKAKPPEEREAPGDQSRLAIDFEHHLKSGTLKVWVDDDVVLEEELDARVAKKILSFRLRKGSLGQVLEVEPGKHTVRVQVRWDGKVKTKWISGTFKGGATKTLRIRVRRIFGELSLDWR